MNPGRSSLAGLALLGCAISFLLLCPQTRAAESIGQFQFTSLQEARARWTPDKDARPVWIRQDGGLVFPLPFTERVDRFYWDQRFPPVDLSRVPSFSLEITLEKAEASRTLSLYFKSGEGWYHWSRPVRGEGRHTLTIRKSECGVEGTPAGWGHIDGLRVSPWKGTSTDGALVIHSLTKQSSRIMVVEGTRSTRNATERELSRRSARRLSRLLAASGIAHGTMDDDGVIAGGLADADVALLAYQPRIPPPLLQALRSFLDRGGKLIVFQSESAELARAMHMRLGAHIPAERPGRWASMRFSNTPPNAPQAIHQIAWNLIPVHAADNTARVISHWHDAWGVIAPEPAWVQSRQGAWCSQILVNDDEAAKEKLLLALIGKWSPDAWRDAARHAMLHAGRIGEFPDLPATLAHLRGSPRARAAAGEAAQLHRQMRASFARGAHPATVQQAEALRRTLVRGYAAMQTPRTRELRGVWDHHATGWYPGDWERTCRILAEHGINAIFPNVAWPGRVHYRSDFLPASRTLNLYGDQLRQCLAAARAHGLQVHAWKICWNYDNAPPESIAQLRREGRLQRSAAGTDINWLCPSHPANVEQELRAIEELAAAGVHGVHLDYIRYPQPSACFCAGCRQRFERSVGRSVSDWPGAVQDGGALRDRWVAWRAEQITSFVRQARQRLRARYPNVQLSAAVYQRYPSCRDALGQDWGRWLAEDLVDFVAPMNYTEDLLNFRTVTREQLALPRARGRVYPGIGITSSDSQLTADQVIDQIRAARELGAEGYLLYQLSTTLRDEVLPALRLGITR